MYSVHPVCKRLYKLSRDQSVWVVVGVDIDNESSHNAWQDLEGPDCPATDNPLLEMLGISKKKFPSQAQDELGRIIGLHLQPEPR